MHDAVLAVRNLKKYYPTPGPGGGGTGLFVKAVDDVSFTIRPGETLGLVGESGCGKTTTASCILGLQSPSSGTITVDGRDISTLDRNGRAHYRKSIQAVFQDPYSSLNPRQLVRDIVAEPLIASSDMSRGDRRNRVIQVLEQVGLSADSGNLYPHEFSGGQRQRIAMARALALQPRLIVLDEPVSALDVSIRAQIMNLLKDLQQQYGVAYLLIAHDLATVRYMCHRVRVMYLGKIVETGLGDALFSEPLHPYTQALLSAALPSHPDEPTHKIALIGEVPSPVSTPSGCSFHPRCFRVMMNVCPRVEPILVDQGPERKVSCHLYPGQPPGAEPSVDTMVRVRETADGAMAEARQGQERAGGG